MRDNPYYKEDETAVRGYAHRLYAESLREFGESRKLPYYRESS